MILRLCGDSVQQSLRRVYLTRLVMTDRIEREDEQDFLGQMLSPGDVVADIGANIGTYTRQLSLPGRSDRSGARVRTRVRQL